MARIRLPQPRTVRLAGRVRAWASQPRRVVALAGAYSLLAAIALVAVVPWLISQSPALRFALELTSVRASELVRDGFIAVASLAASVGLRDVLGALRPDLGLWVGLTGLACAYTGCATGLHKLISTPRASDEPIPVRA